MRKCENISPYMRNPLVTHIRLCNCSILNFLIYEENLIFLFISVVTTPETVCGGGASLEQRRLDRVHGEVVYVRGQGRGGRGGRQQGRRQRSIWSNHAKYLYRQMPIFRHPFFQKTVFFSKKCFVNPPSKFLEVCLNSEYM